MPLCHSLIPQYAWPNALLSHNESEGEQWTGVECFCIPGWHPREWRSVRSGVGAGRSEAASPLGAHSNHWSAEGQKYVLIEVWRPLGGTAAPIKDRRAPRASDRSQRKHRPKKNKCTTQSHRALGTALPSAQVLQVFLLQFFCRCCFNASNELYVLQFGSKKPLISHSRAAEREWKRDLLPYRAHFSKSQVFLQVEPKKRHEPDGVSVNDVRLVCMWVLKTCQSTTPTRFQVRLLAQDNGITIILTGICFAKRYKWSVYRRDDYTWSINTILYFVQLEEILFPLCY